MIFKHLLLQMQTILACASQKNQRAFWVILALSLFLGMVELCVAGAVSLLGVTMASPQSIVELQLIEFLLVQVPSLSNFFDSPVMILLSILILVVLGVTFKNALLGYLTYRQSLLSYSMMADLGSALTRKYLAKPYVWHLNADPVDAHSILQFRAHIALFTVAALTCLTQGSISFFLLVGGTLLAPAASLMVFGITGMACMVTYKVSRRALVRHNEAITQLQLQSNKVSLAALQGIREVQVYGRADAFAKELDQTMQAISPHQAISLTLQPLPAWIIEVTGLATLLLALAVMVHLDYPVARVTGTLTLLAAMAWRLLPCMNKTITGIMNMQGHSPFLRQFFEALEPDTPAASGTLSTPAAPGTLSTPAAPGTLSTPAASSVSASDCPVITGSSLAHQTIAKQASPKTCTPAPAALTGPLTFCRTMELSHVSFTYPGATAPSLLDISLRIDKGRSAGIIGRSGSGKSTLIGLLTGLLTPSSGVITLDDTVLAHTSGTAFSHLLGYVPQSPYLMSATLAANVAFSRWGEPVDMKRVMECCDMAAIDFLHNLPQGLDTMIGERGVRLSGGQVQRIAIARALYSSPQILLFDEATSALDGAAETLIQTTLTRLAAHITTVIVAHRLSTVEHCDCLYWMESGAIIASGPPATLLRDYQKKLLLTPEPANKDGANTNPAQQPE